MPLKTPKFWYRAPSTHAPFLERALEPFSHLYGAAHRYHFSSQNPVKFKTPILCAGNLVAGGGGKTPTLIALYDLVLKNSIAQRPFFVCKGYGGSEYGPQQVKADDSVHDVGDEALLLVQHGRTIAARDRVKGVQEAQTLSADLILMDDGFQNNKVQKDISFLVIDGASGFGNEKLLPCGPLREPIKDGLARADAIILIGQDQRDISRHIPPDLPVFSATLHSTYAGTKSGPHIAFCGLARPEKFKHTLEQEGFDVVQFHDFADHHPYTEVEILRLLNQAKETTATLITTEKDHMRLPQEYKDQIKTLPVKIQFSNERALLEFLTSRLQVIV